TTVGSKIRFGLVAVKNVGEGAIESIIDARKNGRFSSLYDFCERVALQKVNKRVVESLIKCGAFDSTDAGRRQMMESLEDVLDYGQRVQKERSGSQISLFDVVGSGLRPTMPAIDEWDEKQLLAFEKESLGFYITGHPLTRYEALLDKFTNANSISIKEKNDGATVRIGGIIRNTKTIKTKKGDLMAFVTIEDLLGSIEVTVFSSVYKKIHDFLVDDNPIVLQGQVQKDENSVKILVDSLIPIDKVEETWTASIHFNLDITKIERTRLAELYDIINKHPGLCLAYIHLRDPDKTETIIALPDTMKLKAGSALTREVNRFLGYNAVETVCREAAASPQLNNFRKKGLGN
ncbi:MAG: DNA polymerase III subunit alpha, partial [Desulfobacterales bacterium]|nr:DNA polymerase III subunit alpha [Desulfobacterales bacterium]